MTHAQGDLQKPPGVGEKRADQMRDDDYCAAGVEPCPCAKAALAEATDLRLVNAQLLDVLVELKALVKGECPSLLNEDSGGDAMLDIAIDDAIARATGNAK